MEDTHQNLSCLRSGADYSRFTGSNTAEELLTTLLRQLNVWCESDVSHNNMLEVFIVATDNYDSRTLRLVAIMIVGKAEIDASGSFRISHQY